MIKKLALAAALAVTGIVVHDASSHASPALSVDADQSGGGACLWTPLLTSRGGVCMNF